MTRTSAVRALLLAAAFAAGCAAPDATTGPAWGGTALARGSTATTLYRYTLHGDIASDPGGTAPTATMPTSAPFEGVSLSNVTVTVGVPTGTIAACRTGSATYATDFGPNAGLTWVGTLTIVKKTRTLNFLGTRVGGTETFQFSISDATGGPVQAPGPMGSYTYSYTDARLFSDSRSTYFDGLYRCVNLTVTATP
jgi:hypothetical protein